MPSFFFFLNKSKSYINLRRKDSIFKKMIAITRNKIKKMKYYEKIAERLIITHTIYIHNKGVQLLE